jgi:hypothetical protein
MPFSRAAPTTSITEVYVAERPGLIASDVVIRVARKAEQLYPGVVGEVLGAEIRDVLNFPWLGFASRAARLMRAIQETEVTHP